MKIQTMIKKCNLCGNFPKLIESPMQMGSTPFIIIGESPAKDGWIDSKRAFYNTQQKLQATGRVLEKLLNTIGYSIRDIYFTECCKCLIDDRKFLNKYSNNCLPILKQQLKETPCTIIVPMGAYVTQTILQKKIKKFADVVGKVFNLKIGNKHFKVLPIYHPSPLNPKGYKENLELFKVLKNLE